MTTNQQQSTPISTGYFETWNIKWADFAIVVKTGEELKCHKVVLAKASTYIEEMLSSQDPQTNKFEVKEFSLETVSSFLEYIYTDYEWVPMQAVYKKQFDQTKFTPELISLCYTYQVKSLLEECSHHYMTNMTDTNVVSIWMEAERCQMTELKNSALKYIARKKENIGNVLDIEEAYECPELMKSLVNFMALHVVLIDDAPLRVASNGQGGNTSRPTAPTFSCAPGIFCTAPQPSSSGPPTTNAQIDNAPLRVSGNGQGGNTSRPAAPTFSCTPGIFGAAPQPSSSGPPTTNAQIDNAPLKVSGNGQGGNTSRPAAPTFSCTPGIFGAAPQPSSSGPPTTNAQIDNAPLRVSGNGQGGNTSRPTGPTFFCAPGIFGAKPLPSSSGTPTNNAQIDDAPQRVASNGHGGNTNKPAPSTFSCAPGIFGAAPQLSSSGPSTNNVPIHRKLVDYSAVQTGFTFDDENAPPPSKKTKPESLFSIVTHPPGPNFGKRSK